MADSHVTEIPSTEVAGQNYRQATMPRPEEFKDSPFDIVYGKAKPSDTLPSYVDVRLWSADPSRGMEIGRITFPETDKRWAASVVSNNQERVVVRIDPM